MHPRPNEPGSGATSSLAMMALMMVCCLAVVLLVLLIPVVGWPVGITIVAVGAVAMLLFHQRFMRHGHH